MTPIVRSAALTALALVLFSAGAASAAPLDVAGARLSTVGAWTGKLEYLDYGTHQWFGIDARVVIEDEGDGVTLVRKADFDDGPRVGNVRITSISMLDPAKSETRDVAFRKGHEVSLDTWSVALAGPATDATHWVMVEQLTGQDDNRPARLRETTRRDGDTLVTLKEVDFLDDGKDVWIQRNRTSLTRIDKPARP